MKKKDSAEGDIMTNVQEMAPIFNKGTKCATNGTMTSNNCQGAQRRVPRRKKDGVRDAQRNKKKRAEAQRMEAPRKKETPRGHVEFCQRTRGIASRVCVLVPTNVRRGAKRARKDKNEQ